MLGARACTTTSCTSTTCRRSTGWTWSRRSRPTRRRPRALAESLSPWPRQRPHEIAGASRTSWPASSSAGQLGIFTNGYWGHPAMKLPPEVNLLAVAPLPAGARRPAQGQPGRGDPRLQDAATSRTSRSAASPTPINLDSQSTLNMEKLLRDQEPASTRSATSCSSVYLVGRRRDRRASTPTGLRYGAGRHQLPRGAGPAARRQGHAVRPARRLRSWAATSAAYKPIKSFDDAVLPATTSARAIAHAWYDGELARCTRTRARPSRSTPTFEDERQVLLGQGADASRASRCRSGRSPRCCVGLRGRPRADASAGRPRCIGIVERSPRPRSRSAALHSTHRPPRGARRARAP
ncbi:MAG: nickel-dependent hydrogenase large subunit [Chromatiales bacterium]|nr:nickel-dependent hydrogenase large subunit [Chromatiales bacterium]